MTSPKTYGGSQVIAALEAAWKAVQKHVTDLPDVVFVTGSWRAIAGEHGHTIRDRWVEGQHLPGDHAEDVEDTGGAVTIDPQTRKAELCISGERLGDGAKLTFQTMLHEAAHVLAGVRGIQDTSRGFRYHNRRFVALCEELGLEWPEGQQPHATIGFSAVVIRPDTLRRYAKVIARLEKAIRLYVASYVPSESSTTTTTTTGGTSAPWSGRGQGGTARKSTNLPVATCECDEPRKLRIAQSTLDIAPITCGACGADFQIR